MAKQQNTLDHAKHNEEVCNTLVKYKHNDWVVTTAYYSAIYYAGYELFPNQYDIAGRPSQCHNFADYFSKLPQPKDSKHSVREDMVHEFIPEIYTSFSTLREMSSTARYKNYKVSDEEVELALECLAEVKSFCDKA